MRNTISAFQRDITTFVQSLGEESIKLVQQEAAKLVADVRSKSPVPPAYRLNIGGRAAGIFDGPLGNLRLNVNDAIEFYFDHRREVAQKTLDQLRLNSPVVSGTYQDSFTLFVDHEEIGSVAAGLSRIVPGVRVEIINTTPYARRLEVGKQRDGSPFVVQVPPGMVARSVAAMQRGQYRKLADVFFTFTSLSNAALNQGTLVGTRYVNNLGKTVVRRNLRDRRAGTAITYPAVIIAERVYGLRNR